MRLCHIIVLLAMITPAFAETAVLDVEISETAESEYVPLTTAIVQVMNKQAGRTQTLSVPVGQTIKFDKMDISARKCLGVNEFLPEDYFLFAEIQKGDRKIFSGWMTKNEPGANPLQDADYDLWLVKCE